MIKYFEIDRFSEYGSNIVPAHSNQSLTKLASPGFSPEIERIILSMKRVPEFYYVLMNACGSDSYWSQNRNGDFYPESGLSHLSLRSDMGTEQDYGYKTMEYYGKLYKNHVNKNPKNSFGEVIFSSYNWPLHRMELIVGINKFTGKDIIDSLENDGDVSVSIGCKVKFDVCSICGNMASTKDAYCNHIKNYLRALVTDDMAQKWSRETGRKILPGTLVGTINPYPRFFDISRVYVGADRTAKILTHVASVQPTVSGVDLGEVYGAGVTDDMIDKLALLKKKSDIDKQVGGDALSKPQGDIVAIKKSDMLRKAIDAKVENSINSEPMIPNETLDSIATNYPLQNILSTIMGLGITPKPRELQRIILIKIERPDIANYLDDHNMCFNNQEIEQNPIDLKLSDERFNDYIAKALENYIKPRSCFPSFLEERCMMNKQASEGIDKTLMPTPTIDWPKTLTALGIIGSIYAGLKLSARGKSPADIAKLFIEKPYLRNIIGGGVILTLMNKMIGNSQHLDPYISRPASEYPDTLRDPEFTGHVQKYASLGIGNVTSSIALPSSYLVNSYNQKSYSVPSTHLFKLASFNSIKTCPNLDGVEASIKKLVSSCV